MKLTSTWIQEWLGRTILSSEQMVEALGRAGMEIEQVSYPKTLNSLIVICLVKKVVQHPQADRLKLVDVDTGSKLLRIVCGADNVRAGMKVPLAQIGAILPNGDIITAAKLRGELSEGMLCSAHELGLGSDHSGILELDPMAQIGAPVQDLLPHDTIFDLKTPANRFDVLSVVGLSREVAAMTNIEMANTSVPALRWSQDSSVVGEQADGVSAIHMVKLTVDSSLSSPAWMQDRLRALGMRPVNLIVDITNYVMLEYGQPLHAYDGSKVRLPFRVRRAGTGEKLKTLDNIERSLHADDLVVTGGNEPIGLAGVMGGFASEVSANTSEIWLEAATFDAVQVRKSAQRHGLRSEASARFERSLSPVLAELGIRRAVELMQQYAGAQVVQAVYTRRHHEPASSVEVSLDKLRQLLGFRISSQTALQALHRLQIAAVYSSKTRVISVAEVPWWRSDIRTDVDIVEEIVRVVGYDQVPSTIPVWAPTTAAFDQTRSKRRVVRDAMYAAGLFEVMTYSFVSAQQIHELGFDDSSHLKLQNPLSIEQQFLRTSLLASHIDVAKRNRKYAKELGFFEISKVFAKQSDDSLPLEPLKLAVSLTRPSAALADAKGLLDALAWSLNIKFEILMAESPHEPNELTFYSPGNWAMIALEGAVIGHIGRIHEPLARSNKLVGEMGYFEIDLDVILAQAGARQYRVVSKFPNIKRDIALLVDQDVLWTDFERELTEFDVTYVGDYVGETIEAGKRSVTLRMTTGFDDRTPTEAEAEHKLARLIAKARHKLRAEPR